jgi:hypothetical protein
MEVNVFQRGCDVVIQKSLREGFGEHIRRRFLLPRLVRDDLRLIKETLAAAP